MTKKNYATNKTDVYHVDDIWSFDVLDLKVYGPESIRSYRYVLVVFDKFSSFGWTVLLRIDLLKQYKTLSKKFLKFQNEN